MILVDTNILMYACGHPHPQKQASVAFLRRVAEGDAQGVIDAEVLQELMHRYLSLQRWQDGRKVFAIARRFFPEVLPITGAVLDQAKSLVDETAGLTARDAVHAAVVAVYGLEGICTFDHDFDRIPGCRRIEP